MVLAARLVDQPPTKLHSLAISNGFVAARVYDFASTDDELKVGSEEIGFHTGKGLYPISMAHHHPSYVSTDPVYAHPMSQARAAIPVLQSRATIPSRAHNSYHNAYSAGTVTLRGTGRHDPTAGAFQPSEHTDTNHAWVQKPVMEMSSHNTPGFYDVPGTYELGSLHAPLSSLQIPDGRVPSMTAINARSPLDMGSLELSLPADSVYQRALPTLQRQNPSHNLPVPLAEPLELRPSVSETGMSQLAQTQTSRLDSPAGSNSNLVSMDAKAQTSYSTTAKAASRNNLFTPASGNVADTQSLAKSDVGFERSPRLSQISRPSLSETFQTMDPVVSEHHNYYEQIGPISSADMDMSSHEQSRHELALYSYSLDRGDRAGSVVDDQPPAPHRAYTEAGTAQPMP
nr:hypothetical protein CFP56_07685 [Quercus suber]